MNVCLHELYEPRDIMYKHTYTSMNMYISESLAKTISLFIIIYFSNVYNKVIKKRDLLSIQYG